MEEKISTTGQNLGSVPDGKKEEEFRQEVQALKLEVSAEIARLDAEVKRSQRFIDFVDSIGDRMNAVGAKINNLFDKFLKKK